MIDILLATYNGEKHINSQVISIIGQTFTDWRLIIHDDGSTDRTVAIIKEWTEKDNRITLIEDEVTCGGAAQNFMHLLQFSTSEFIMFCDQDDIWFDNKVELMYNEMVRLDNTRPRVVYSNSLVWKPNKGVTGLATITFATDLRHLLFLNGGIQGCASMFDCEIRKLMKEYEGVLSMHDHLLQLLAITIGQCSILHIPLMLYRNHDNKVTGETRTRLFTKRNMLFNREQPVIDKNHYLTIRNFYHIYGKRLNQKDSEMVEAYLLMPQISLVRKLWMVIKYKCKIYDSSLLLLVKILLRPYHKINI